MRETALAVVRCINSTPLDGVHESLARSQAEDAEKCAPDASPEQMADLFVNIAANLQVLGREAKKMGEGYTSKIIGSVAMVFSRTAAIFAEKAGLVEPPPAKEKKTAEQVLSDIGLDSGDLRGSLKNLAAKYGLPVEMFGDFSDEDIRIAAESAADLL